jgi:hypothetical protein
MATNNTATATAPARVETDISTLLFGHHPILIAPASAPATHWVRCWESFISEMPVMFRNKEEWFYFHRGVKRTMAGSDAQLQAEFANLKATHGFKEVSSDSINNLNIYAVIPHPKKKKMGLRADLQFKRFLGKPEEDEDGNDITKGAGQCPLMWGLGVMADGLTYINVRFTEVPLDKDKVKIALNLMNAKWVPI